MSAVSIGGGGGHGGKGGVGNHRSSIATAGGRFLGDGGAEGGAWGDAYSGDKGEGVGEHEELDALLELCDDLEDIDGRVWAQVGYVCVCVYSRRMLTCAHVCSRVLTCSDVCRLASGRWRSSSF